METSVLNQAWAVVLPMSSAAALGPLRTVPGIEVRAVDDRIWLRGATLDAAFRRQLLGLPALERYGVADDDALTPWGRIVPSGELPDGTWLPLRKWCELEMPPAGWPAEKPASVKLSLTPSHRERPAGALLTDWTTWAAYAETAPLIRLEGLAFAVNETRQTIIRGDMLPPLPGRRLVDDGGILVLAGWAWTPDVEAAVARAVFGLGDGECALWLTSERWERIAADAWCRATRSAVRASNVRASEVRASAPEAGHV